MNSYTLHITLYDPVFLVTAVIGLNFALQLWFTQSVNRAANRYLALALGVVVLWMAGLLGNDLRLWTSPLQFSLALGPLIYFYVRKATQPVRRFGWKDLLHFFPALLELILWISGTSFPIKQLAFISVGTYLYLSHRLIEHFYLSLQFNDGDRYRLEWRWLDRLLMGLGIALLTWIPIAAIDYFVFGFTLDSQVYHPLSLLMAVMLIRTGALVFFRSGNNAFTQAPHIPKSPVSVALRQKGQWLKKTIETSQLYQDPELSVNSLARQLDLTTHELSRIINLALKKNFYDFINEYRVREVIHKMQDPAYNRLTLLGIAYESGFNSKSTFNRIFREMTGISPVQYKSNLKKERPIPNLRPQYGHREIVLRHETAFKWPDEKLNLITMFHHYMTGNYLRTAYRSLKKNRSFTIINIFGLAFGLAASMLIMFYVLDELSYDKYNLKAGRIYRADWDVKWAEGYQANANSPTSFAGAVKESIPDVEEAVRFKDIGPFTVKKANDYIRENRGVFVDPSVFRVFTLPMIEGDPKSALLDPSTVVITESIARKYFGSTNATGKSIDLNGNWLLKVTGVIKDVPKQSHFHFDFFISMSSYHYSMESDWLNSSFNTYLLLRPGTDPKLLEPKLDALNKKYFDAQFKQMMNGSFYTNGNYTRIALTPLTEIHLTSNRSGDFEPNNSIKYIYIFSAIALFILVIACVNFMTLSTARSSNRAREVGVRKTLGSSRSHLIFQFLSESFIITFFSVVASVIIAILLLPLFNQLAGKDLSIDGVAMIRFIPFLLVITLVVGLLAGFYPSIYLSSFKPVDVLKGRLASGFKNSFIRSSLVVFQFSISVFLIIGTLVIYTQLRFIQNRDLGYKRDQVLVIHNTYLLGKKALLMKKELKQMAGVQNVSLSGFVPTGKNGNTFTIYRDATLDPGKAIRPEIWNVDEDYLTTLQIKLKEGRNFHPAMSTDSNAYIINEAAAHSLGLTGSVIGKKLYNFWFENYDLKVKHIREITIIGVVKNFNFASLKDNITPLVMELNKNTFMMSVKVGTTNLPQLVSRIEQKWKELAPGQEFTYSFMNDDFNAAYRFEQRSSTLFFIFTVLAIVIACLGLFGLAAYATEQRTKEIGIRKILGASILQINSMLSKDFFRLIVLAFLIAAPVAWYLMTKWLEDYTYRITIQWWMFALTGMSILIVGLLTISFQSVRAALANPVKSLRAE